jgi:outer membrane protein assembly factor BamB
MKKTIVLGIMLSFSLLGFAQNEFKPEQTVSYPFKITTKNINPSHSLVLVTDYKQVAMMDAVTCKVKWSIGLNDKFKIEKAEWCGFSTENDSVWIVYKEKNERKTLTLNPQTGEKVAGPVVEKPMADEKSKSGEKGKLLDIKHSYPFSENGVTVRINYKMKLMANIFSSSDYALTVLCDGKYNWSQTVNAKVTPALIPYGSSKLADFLTAYVQGDKLFIVYDGFSVLDLASGKILWTSGFDYVNADLGLTKLTQQYPKAPYPYCDGKVVYVTDMHDDARKLKALDASTGKMIWESEKYDKDAMVSNMYFVNNTIINQFGGRIFTLICKVSSNSETYISDYAFPADGGFKSYDATSGKLLWTTFDKAEYSGLKKRTTNSIVKDNIIYVATEKELFAIDALTGKLNHSTPLSKLDIGFPKDISFMNDNIFLYATDGFAMLTTDGKVVYNTPTKEIFKTDVEGSTYVVWIGDDIYNLNSFLCFDPLTGKIAGKIKDTAHPYFSESGDAFIKFDGNKEMLRFKIF